MSRKMAAAVGLANNVRRWCSNEMPMTPTGMVTITSNQHIRSADVRTYGASRRTKRTIERTPPVMISTQSCQKKPRRASAVATWRPTRKAR